MGTQTSIRLISYSQELLNGEPIYVSSNCLPVKASKFESAGQAFHSAALRLLGFCDEKETDSDDQSVSTDNEQTYMPSSESYSSSKGKKKSSGEGKQQQDHYALLGLSHLRFLATEEQIRKSYRETALKHHPDKQAALLLAEETEAAKQAKKDEIENHFKAIQEAYEVLMDPVRRRIYDSTDEFDDEIPSDCDPRDFFKVFGPAFMRNGRWSVNQPVPSLGDDNASLAEVDAFYNFWYGFKSWREFPHADEFDLEQAESRDHKRWMERQNAKLTEKARKEEYARIRALVDNAYKRDPRILKRKEEEKAEKKRKKEAKYLAKKLQEEEAARKIEEEKQRKEEEEKHLAEAALHQKKVKEKEKKLLRKERTRLRTLAAPILSQNLLGITEEEIESLCMSLEMEQLKNLCGSFEGKEVIVQAKIIREALGFSNLEDKKEDNKKSSPKPNGTLEVSDRSVLFSSFEKKEKPWGREEVELLRKGMQKYPKGTSRRWEVISEYIGTGRSVEEILKATKTVLLQKPDPSKAFDSFLEKRKPAQSIESPLTTRDETIGASLSENEPERNKVETDNSNKSSSSNDDAIITNGLSASTASEQDQWSSVQERALVQALKTFPKEINQRWERVAAAVPGKTVTQCKKKFALLKENFRSKKTAV